VRTTGAPESVTLGADGAGSAELVGESAAAVEMESHALLAIQAARRGELDAARQHLELALDAIARRGPA
jgi:hypothetical protein